jgi:hypothetical protein
MNNYKSSLSNPLIQKLLMKSDSEKRGAFMAGASWILEKLDIEHPEWNLQAIMPALLEKLSAESRAQAEAQADPRQVKLFSPTETPDA